VTLCCDLVLRKTKYYNYNYIYLTMYSCISQVKERLNFMPTIINYLVNILFYFIYECSNTWTNKFQVSHNKAKLLVSASTN
jgi:hypothetical protein